MKGKQRNLLIALSAILVAGSGLAFIALSNIGDNLVYYWSPTEMLSQGEKAYGPVIRLGGVVAPGTVKWDAAKTELAFQVATDHKPDAAKVPVLAREVPPQMFREGIGVVVEGTFSKSGVFTSERLMVNHSNEYRPPAEGQDLKGYGSNSLAAGPK
jgi:cytochrome c-type biogenesis protein CcmE